MSRSVAIAGASGYAGGELLRLLAGHPELEVTTVAAHSNAGERVRDVHPHLASMGESRFADTSAATLRGHDVVLLALPHGASAALAAELHDAPLLIDCGADHRLERAGDWADYYDGPHAGAWTYGMPELPLAGGRRQRELLRGADRIAVPGCNVTAMTLALAPLVAAGAVDAGDLTSVLAVGPSGAGRTASAPMLGAELMGSATPYAVAGSHRHNPEVRQNLRRASGREEIRLAFTPVLVPAARGILATSTARLAEGAHAADARAALEEAYRGEPFVEVLPEGAWPRTADVIGSNRCSIGVGMDERAGRVVIVSAIDNLGKGTAGAAIQSANLALGLDEAAGLPIDGVAP